MAATPQETHLRTQDLTIAGSCGIQATICSVPRHEHPFRRQNRKDSPLGAVGGLPIRAQALRQIVVPCHQTAGGADRRGVLKMGQRVPPDGVLTEMSGANQSAVRDTTTICLAADCQRVPHATGPISSFPQQHRSRSSSAFSCSWRKGNGSSQTLPPRRVRCDHHLVR